MSWDRSVEEQLPTNPTATIPSWGEPVAGGEGVKEGIDREGEEVEVVEGSGARERTRTAGPTDGFIGGGGASSCGPVAQAKV